MSPSAPVVAVDLGGTKILAGLVLAGGHVRSRVWLPSRDLRGQPGPLLDRIAGAARQAAAEGGADWSEVAAVGLGVPGPLDSSHSVVAVAPNLGWEQLPARAELQRRAGAPPVFMENDVRSAALAEHSLGAGRGFASMVAVFVGSGVGGGLIVNGRLYHGEHGGAGELGHIVVQAGGPRCPCGRRGCVEAMGARDAVARYVAQAVARGKQTALSTLLKGNFSALTSGDLAEAIRQGDAVAVAAARKSARYVGLALGGILNVLDPGVVVLGGGIVEALGDRYVQWARLAARRQALAAASRRTPIVASSLGDDAGLLGAALTAFAGLEQNPRS